MRISKSIRAEMPDIWIISYGCDFEQVLGILLNCVYKVLFVFFHYLGIITSTFVILLEGHQFSITYSYETMSWEKNDVK